MYRLFPVAHTFAAVYQIQHALSTSIQFFIRQNSSLVIVAQFFIIFLKKRHLQIQAGFGSSSAVVDSEPIRKYSPVKTKIFAQHIKTFSVFRTEYPVYPIITTHYRNRFRPARNFKWLIVHFAQRALVNLARLLHAIVFEIVCTEMLDTSAHPAFLQSDNILVGKRSRKHRIFRKIFEIATVARHTLDIYPRCQQNIDIRIQTIVRQSPAHFFCRFPAPCIS